MHICQKIGDHMVKETAEETPEETKQIVNLITLRKEMITTQISNHSTIQTTDLIYSKIKHLDSESDRQETITVDTTDLPTGIKISISTIPQSSLPNSNTSSS